MGQKIHPVGFRVGYIHGLEVELVQRARSFADYLNEDLAIRSHIENKLSHAGSRRSRSRRVRRGRGRHLHRTPGIVIGKSAPRSTRCAASSTSSPASRSRSTSGDQAPELDAKLVAQSIAEQLRTASPSAAR
jgi:small subunit ribosomal protein S3